MFRADILSGNADDKTKTLWFGAIETLIEELNTSNRDAAGYVLPFIGYRAYVPLDYAKWKERWPKRKSYYEDVIFKNKNHIPSPATSPYE